MRGAGTPRAYVWVFALAVVLAGPLFGRADDLEVVVGMRVVTRPGTVLREGDHPVAAGRQYRLFRVEQVSGEWVEVSSGEARGWATAAELIPCEQAVEYLTNEIEIHPGRGALYALRGTVYEALGEPRIALADYHQAIRLDPGDAEAYLLRGDLRASVKQAYDSALDDYDQAIRLDPKLVQAVVRRGDAWMAKHDYDRALKDYERAIRLDSKNVLAFQGRGRAQRAKGDTGRAIDDFLRVVSLQPGDSAAHLDLGRAWYDSKDFERALASFQEAVTLDPGSAPAHNERGRAWAARKRYEPAIADHTRAIRLAPGNASAYFHRGLAWWNLGDFTRAKADYDEAIRLDPAFAEAHNVRAWLQATCPNDTLRNGKAAYDSAVQACSLTNWSTARDLDTLAASCAESGDFVQAVEWEKKAIQLADHGDAGKQYRARLQLYLEKKPFRERAGN